MRYRLRQDDDDVRLAMTEMSSQDVHFCLLRALYSITLDDIEGWYGQCGYL